MLTQRSKFKKVTSYIRSYTVHTESDSSTALYLQLILRIHCKKYSVYTIATNCDLICKNPTQSHI